MHPTSHQIVHRYHLIPRRIKTSFDTLIIPCPTLKRKQKKAVDHFYLQIHKEKAT